MVTNNPVNNNASFTPPGLPSGIGSLSNPQPSGGSGYQLNADSNPDELALLQPLVLKLPGNQSGIPFPGLLFREEQSNSLAVHMYPNLDSARVENMGRNPAVFHVRAILTNHIYPGTNETWVPGILFPSTFIALLNLLNNTVNKILQHPVYGDITVQVQHYSYDLNPKGPRDGAILDMTFIETIGDYNPLSNQLPPPPGAGLAQAANNLDNAIAQAPQSLNPPGLSLSQFFGKLNNIVRQAVAFPTNTIAALDAPILQTINGAASVSASLIKAPAYIANSTLQIIQNTKNTVLGSPLSFAVSYDQSTYQAMQSILAANNTPSQDSFQLINKQLRALIDLLQYYTNQNNAAAAPIIEAIRQLIYQLQQVQSALSLNTNTKSVIVATYVTTHPMTWMQLSRYLNNDIGNLMALNQGLVNDVWVPSNVTINYYQS